VSRSRRTAPDINVTPLVDVVLVLLIIFMVVMPQMESGMPVDLPGLLHPDTKAKAETPFLLSLTATGALYLDKAPLAQDDLERVVAEMHAREPERQVVLKADRSVRYDDVRKVFARCQAAGLGGVSLQVGERHAPTGG